MPGAIYICGGSEECDRHGRFIYYCGPCHKEWQEKNPHTTKAISEYANGRGTIKDINAAKQRDKEGVPMPTLSMTTLEEGRIVAVTETKVRKAGEHPRAPRHRGKSHMEGLHTDTCERCRAMHAPAVAEAVQEAPKPIEADLSVDLTQEFIKVNEGLWARAMELANGDKRKIKVLAHNRILVG